MKKFFFLLITFIVTDISYASFPITDTLKIQKDFLFSETQEQYHVRIQKRGSNVSNCSCTICQKESDVRIVTKKSSVKKMYLLAAVLLLVATVWFLRVVIAEAECINDRSNCNDTSHSNTKNGVLTSLFWMSFLLVISVGIAIKARITQIREKKIKIS